MFDLGVLDNRYDVTIEDAGDGFVLIIKDDRSDQTFQEEFKFTHDCRFGMDVEDVQRAQIRAEEIVDSEL